MTYNIKHTDTSKTPIQVEEATETNTGLDVYLFGRVKTEYGEQINENLFHLLENFACPELSGTPDVPDLALTYTDLLAEPIEGQFWYNMTQKRMFFWDTVQWVGIGTQGDISANWGRLCHGEQLPQPVSPTTGHIFDYDECIWSVSPAVYALPFDYMACSTDATANVTMQYTFNNVTDIINGVANYLIIGIKENNNIGTQLTPAPPPSRGATATPTPTPSMTPTPTPTTGAVPSIPLAVGVVKSQDIDSSLKTRFPELPGDFAIKWPLGVSTGALINIASIQPWVDQGTNDFYIAVPSSYPATRSQLNDNAHKYILISDDAQDGRVYHVIDVLVFGTTDGVVVNGQPGTKWLKIQANAHSYTLPTFASSNFEMEAPPESTITDGVTKVYPIINPQDTSGTIASTFNESVLTENRYDLNITGGTAPYRVVSFKYLTGADLSLIYALERHQVVGVTGTNFSGAVVPIAIDHAITNFNTITDFTELRPATETAMVNLPAQFLSYSVPIVDGESIPDYLITNVVLDVNNFYFNKNNLDFTATEIIGSTTSPSSGGTTPMPGNTVDYTTDESLIPMGFEVVVEDSLGATAVTQIGARYHAQTLDYQRSAPDVTPLP